MDHSKNSASRPAENQLPVLQNSTAMSSFDPSSLAGSIFTVDQVPMVNLESTPLCADLLGNMEESKSTVQVRPDNSDRTMNIAPLANPFWIPPISRSPFIRDDTNISEVNFQSLGEEATHTSHVHMDAITSAEAKHFSSLFGNTEIPQIDLNTVSDGVNAEIQQHSLREITTGTDIASTRISRALGDNSMNAASQFDDFRVPHISQHQINVGGATFTGDQIHNHGGVQIGASHVHGGNNNNEIMFSSLFSNYHNPQNERSSLRVGSNKAQLIQQNSQGGTAIGTSHVQSARHNVDGSTSPATQLRNLQSPQVNTTSRSIGVKRPAAVQPNRQVKIGATRSHMHGGLRNSNMDATIPILFSNNLRGRQINRSPVSIEGGLPSTRCANSQDQVIDGVSPGSNATSLNSVDSSLIDRDFLSVGGSMPDIRHYQIQENQRPINHAKGNVDQSSSVISPEQTGSGFLNLGFVGNTTMGLGTDDSGGGIYGGNEDPVRSHLPGFSGNFLSLGGDLGDQPWCDNANTTNFGTNAVLNSNPYMSLQGNQMWSDHVSPNNFGPNAMLNYNRYTGVGRNMGNQTRSSNGTNIVLGTNIRDTSNSSTNSQTVQANFRKYIPRPSGRTLLPGGNEIPMYANAVPYRGGISGHSGGAMRPFNSVSAGLHANEQARVSNLRHERTSQGQIPNEPFITPPQHANNVHHISTNSSTASMLSAATARAFRQDRPGTQVPAERIQYTHSPKVLLGPSVSGTPVSMARHVGLAQTEAILRQKMSSSIPNSSTTISAPHGRKVLQTAVNTSTQSAGQTNAVYHLKWKGPEESFKSTGDKCHICKRDLSYTATGPVFQPSVPPATAVLPCGHTFHDECLQRITPEDQLKDPPCIPCAIDSVENR